MCFLVKETEKGCTGPDFHTKTFRHSKLQQIVSIFLTFGTEIHISQFYKCVLGHFNQVPSWVELNDVLPQVLSTLSIITHLPPKLLSSVCWLSPITTLFPYHHPKMWRIHGKQTKVGEIRQGGGNIYCWAERNGRTAVRWGCGSFVPSACGICLLSNIKTSGRDGL